MSRLQRAWHDAAPPALVHVGTLIHVEILKDTKEEEMGRPVVHWELWSDDPEGIGKFYAKVFDWNVREIPDLKYRLVETGGTGGIDGGIMQPQKGPWPAKLAFYIDVDDVDAYLRRIADAGGKTLVAPQEIQGVGQFALFEDPDGRAVGLWKQKA